jgi:hypothetical protein
MLMKGFLVALSLFFALVGLLFYGALETAAQGRAWYSCGPASCYVEVDLTQWQARQRPRTVDIDFLAPVRTARGAGRRHGLATVAHRTLDLEGVDLRESIEFEIAKGFERPERVRITVEGQVFYAVGR